MKNILILSPDSIRNSMGGLGVHLYNVVTNIDATINNVTVITVGDQQERINNINIYSIEGFPSLMATKEALTDTFILQSRYVALALSLIADNSINKPDVLHVLDWSVAVAAQEIARVTGAKIVFAVHLSINNYLSNIHPMQKMAYDRACAEEFEACKRADAIIHVTQRYADLFPFAIFQHKTEIIHNGVNAQEFANAESYILPGNRPRKFVYIGRIAEMKNVQTLWTTPMPGDVDLIFIGGEQGSSQKLIADLQTLVSTSDHIHYIPGLYGQEKVNAMCSADVIIMPSTHEPFGLVALEALAAGQGGKTILMSSFVDGLGEFLTEDVAISCGTSIWSIQEAIARYSLMTPAELTEMRNAGVVLSNQYSWINTTRAIEAVWAKL